MESSARIPVTYATRRNKKRLQPKQIHSSNPSANANVDNDCSELPRKKQKRSLSSRPLSALIYHEESSTRGAQGKKRKKHSSAITIGPVYNDPPGRSQIPADSTSLHHPIHLRKLKENSPLNTLGATSSHPASLAHGITNPRSTKRIPLADMKLNDNMHAENPKPITLKSPRASFGNPFPTNSPLAIAANNETHSQKQRRSPSLQIALTRRSVSDTNHESHASSVKNKTSSSDVRAYNLTTRFKAPSPIMAHSQIRSNKVSHCSSPWSFDPNSFTRFSSVVPAESNRFPSISPLNGSSHGYFCFGEGVQFTSTPSRKQTKAVEEATKSPYTIPIEIKSDAKPVHSDVLHHITPLPSLQKGQIDGDITHEYSSWMTDSLISPPTIFRRLPQLSPPRDVKTVDNTTLNPTNISASKAPAVPLDIWSLLEKPKKNYLEKAKPSPVATRCISHDLTRKTGAPFKCVPSISLSMDETAKSDGLLSSRSIQSSSPITMATVAKNDFLHTSRTIQSLSPITVATSAPPALSSDFYRPPFLFSVSPSQSPRLHDVGHARGEDTSLASTGLRNNIVSSFSTPKRHSHSPSSSPDPLDLFLYHWTDSPNHPLPTDKRDKTKPTKRKKRALPFVLGRNNVCGQSFENDDGTLSDELNISSGKSD